MTNLKKLSPKKNRASRGLKFIVITVNKQNRAAFVDNKRNMRKCNCHASVTLIGSILSLVIILRITTKSQSSKKKVPPAYVHPDFLNL